jgi:hypothetical protein
MEQYPDSNKKFYNIKADLDKEGIRVGDSLPPVYRQAFILPEGKHDP